MTVNRKVRLLGLLIWWAGIIAIGFHIDATTAAILSIAMVGRSIADDYELKDKK